MNVELNCVNVLQFIPSPLDRHLGLFSVFATIIITVLPAWIWTVLLWTFVYINTRCRSCFHRSGMVESHEIHAFNLTRCHLAFHKDCSSLPSHSNTYNTCADWYLASVWHWQTESLLLTQYMSVVVHWGFHLRMSSFCMLINHLCYLFCKIPFFTCLLDCVNCIYLWKLWIVFWIRIFCWLCMLSVLSPRLWYIPCHVMKFRIEVLDFNVF